MEIRLQVSGFDPAESAVKADPQCRKVGNDHRQKVIDDQ